MVKSVDCLWIIFLHIYEQSTELRVEEMAFLLIYA